VLPPVLPVQASVKSFCLVDKATRLLYFRCCCTSPPPPSYFARPYGMGLVPCRMHGAR
jgi:hypothetical protein